MEKGKIKLLLFVSGEQELKMHPRDKNLIDFDFVDRNVEQPL